MIAFAEALETVVGKARFLGEEQVPLEHAAGRVLARDVHSDMDMPPFNKSAMDGFACRRDDLGTWLKIVETLPAGLAPTKPIRAGECAKIMTGAVVPAGADCVFMVEFAEERPDDEVRFTGGKTSDNICLRGEDVHQGDVVLRRGRLVLPQHVALLAAVGCARPHVARRPSVGIVATGNELVSPEQTPSPAQIRNTNSPQMVAQAARAGIQARSYGIARDTVADLTTTVTRAVAENDVVILSGGVSMGEYDLVPGVMRDLGFTVVFDRVAVKPGRPTTFFEGPRICAFGLPGNPVSTFVLFEIVVKPFLLKMQGCEYEPLTCPMALSAEIKRRKHDRDAWVPVALAPNGTVRPVEYHGSAHSSSLCEADGLVCMPVGVGKITQGESVPVRFVR